MVGVAVEVTNIMCFSHVGHMIYSLAQVVSPEKPTAPTEMDQSPQIDGDPMTDSELAQAAKVKLIHDPTPRVKAVLPGPTWPLDSHPDNVRAFVNKWNMDPKNGPEVMQALESGPSTASSWEEPSTPAAPSVPPSVPAAAPAAAESKMPEAVTSPVAAAEAKTAVAVATPVPVDTPTTVATPVPTPTTVERATEVATPVEKALTAVATPVAETPAAVAASSVVPTPADALQEMEALVHAAQASPPAPTARRAQQPADTVNWSSHKKEGMRLTRLMDSNAAAYPHMAKMWEGSKKDRKTKQIYKNTIN